MKMNITKEWLLKGVDLEEDLNIAAGCPECLSNILDNWELLFGDPTDAG